VLIVVVMMDVALVKGAATDDGERSPSSVDWIKRER
jgi:hypothetical protein